MTSIWHLAALTRLQGPMVAISPPFSSALLSPLLPALPAHCGFQLGGGLRPQLPAQEVGCSLFVNTPRERSPWLPLKTRKTGRKVGEGQRGQLLLPLLSPALAQGTRTSDGRSPLPEGRGLVLGVATEHVLGGGGKRW